MAQDPPARQSPADLPSGKLRRLAAWYRDFAERAGNPVIWEARLLAAADFEAEAARVDAMFAPLPAGAAATEAPSAAALRSEARRLIERAQAAADDQSRRQLAARALALSQRAEALANALEEDPRIIRMNIERYRAMLAAGIDDGPQKRLVERMLGDAETALAAPRREPR